MGRGIDREPLLRVQDFSFTWPGADRRCLDGINASVEPGQWIVCTGGAASGKSSLALALAGLIPHKSGGKIRGQVLVQGTDSRDLSPVRISDIAGISFQFPQGQFFTLTLEEEIAFSLEQRGMEPQEIRRRVHESLDFTGLGGYEDRSPQELSGGEMQRAALAILLAQKPAVYLLDEPLAALDPKGRQDILNLLSRIRQKENASILLFTKSPLPVMPYADALWLMEQGRLSALFGREQFQDSLEMLEQRGCHMSQLYRLGEILREQQLLDQSLWNPVEAESLLFGEEP